MLRRLTLQLLQTTSTKPFYLSNLLLSLPLSHPAPLLQFYVQVLLYASIQHSFVIERKTAPMDMMRTVWKHVLTKVSFQILALRPRFWDTFFCYLVAFLFDILNVILLSWFSLQGPSELCLQESGLWQSLSLSRWLRWGQLSEQISSCSLEVSHWVKTV